VEELLWPKIKEFVGGFSHLSPMWKIIVASLILIAVGAFLARISKRFESFFEWIEEKIFSSFRDIQKIIKIWMNRPRYHFEFLHREKTYTIDNKRNAREVEHITLRALRDNVDHYPIIIPKTHAKKISVPRVEGGDLSEGHNYPDKTEYFVHFKPLKKGHTKKLIIHKYGEDLTKSPFVGSKLRNPCALMKFVVIFPKGLLCKINAVIQNDMHGQTIVGPEPLRLEELNDRKKHSVTWEAKENDDKFPTTVGHEYMIMWDWKS